MGFGASVCGEFRHRNTSRLHMRKCSSSESKRPSSPVREGSEARRAKNEQWNRLTEEATHFRNGYAMGNHIASQGHERQVTSRVKKSFPGSYTHICKVRRWVETVQCHRGFLAF